MQHALNVTEDIFTQHSVSNLRLRHSSFSLTWLGAKPSTVILDERGIFWMQFSTWRPAFLMRKLIKGSLSIIWLQTCTLLCLTKQQQYGISILYIPYVEPPTDHENQIVAFSLDSICRAIPTSSACLPKCSWCCDS